MNISKQTEGKDPEIDNDTSVILDLVIMCVSVCLSIYLSAVLRSRSSTFGYFPPVCLPICPSVCLYLCGCAISTTSPLNYIPHTKFFRVRRGIHDHLTQIFFGGFFCFCSCTTMVTTLVVDWHCSRLGTAVDCPSGFIQEAAHQIREHSRVFEDYFREHFENI